MESRTSTRRLVVRRCAIVRRFLNVMEITAPGPDLDYFHRQVLSREGAISSHPATRHSGRLSRIAPGGRGQAMSPDTVKYFEGLITVYTDNIRISDIKSNIILFLLAISIPTVVAFRLQLPAYMPLFLLLLFPLFSIIVLVVAIYPRFVTTPGFPFFIKRSVLPENSSRRPTTTRNCSRSSVSVALRWRRSSTGRSSSSVSPWASA